jgi:hypothetical protein
LKVSTPPLADTARYDSLRDAGNNDSPLEGVDHDA